MRTHYNWLNYSQRERVIEISELPHMTVPDQTMSLRTILDRYARGLPITGTALEPQYYGDDEYPDVTRLDLSELEDLKASNSSFIKQTQEALKKHEERKAAEKAARTTKLLEKDDKSQKEQASPEKVQNTEPLTVTT